MNQELVDTVKALIDVGCRYDVEALAAHYASDLRIALFSGPELAAFDFEQNLDFFRRLRDAGAPPLDPTARFQMADVQDGIGYVVVLRTMDLGQGRANMAFNLMLRHEGGSPAWKVFREHAFFLGPA